MMLLYILQTFLFERRCTYWEVWKKNSRLCPSSTTLPQCLLPFWAVCVFVWSSYRVVRRMFQKLLAWYIYKKFLGETSMQLYSVFSMSEVPWFGDSARIYFGNKYDRGPSPRLRYHLEPWCYQLFHIFINIIDLIPSALNNEGPILIYSWCREYWPFCIPQFDLVPK